MHIFLSIWSTEQILYTLDSNVQSRYFIFKKEAATVSRSKLLLFNENILPRLTHQEE